MVLPTIVLLLSVLLGVVAGRMRQPRDRPLVNQRWVDYQEGDRGGVLIGDIDRRRLLELCQIDSPPTRSPGHGRARDLRLDLVEIDRQIESTLRDLAIAERQLNAT